MSCTPSGAKDFQELGRLLHCRHAREAHADSILKYLNLVSNTELTTYLKRKLVELYAAAPKNDSRAPTGEDSDADEEAPGKVGAEQVASTPCMDQ